MIHLNFKGQMQLVLPCYLQITLGYLVVTSGYLVVTSDYLIATTGYFLLLQPCYINIPNSLLFS